MGRRSGQCLDMVSDHVSQWEATWPVTEMAGVLPGAARQAPHWTRVLMGPFGFAYFSHLLQPRKDGFPGSLLSQEPWEC